MKTGGKETEVPKGISLEVNSDGSIVAVCRASINPWPTIGLAVLGIASATRLAWIFNEQLRSPSDFYDWLKATLILYATLLFIFSVRARMEFRSFHFDGDNLIITRGWNRFFQKFVRIRKVDIQRVARSMTGRGGLIFTGEWSVSAEGSHRQVLLSNWDRESCDWLANRIAQWAEVHNASEAQFCLLSDLLHQSSSRE